MFYRKYVSKSQFSTIRITIIDVLKTKFPQAFKHTYVFQNINGYKMISLDLIVRPLRLLTAIRFNYARIHGVNLRDVRLEANFAPSESDVDHKEDHFVFTRVTMLGAKWDFER